MKRGVSVTAAGRAIALIGGTATKSPGAIVKVDDVVVIGGDETLAVVCG